MHTITDNGKALGAESRRLLSLIQRNGPVTKIGLARATGFQMSSLNRYLEPLLADGFIAPCGTADSGGGRPPVLYDVRADRLYALGVHIAATYIEILIIDLKVHVLSREHYELTPADTPERSMALIRDSIFRQIDALGLDRGRILGFGLSIFGPFDRVRGAILPQIVRHFHPDWIGYPIVATLEARCGFPVLADIGANNVAMAEYLFGHGRGCQRILCVRCSMSIKTAYIVSGSILRTRNNVEDAFSHMSVDIDGLPCACGNYGCIECYSPAPALVKRFRDERKKGRTTSVATGIEDTTHREILRAADAGDALAAEVVTHAATVLGSGLANYINLLDPDLIIMSGFIVRNSLLYYDTAVAAAKRKSGMFNPGTDTRFIRNNSFPEPGTSGAAILVLETMLFQGDNLGGEGGGYRL